MFHVKHYEELKEGVKKLNIKLTEEMFKKFDLYLSTLLKWNQKINLVSKNDEGKIVRKHILDSLLAIPYIDRGDKVLDIGSGAGFPGVPIKIVRNDITMTLLESRRKRYHFLKHILSILALKGIEVYNKRAEDFSGNYSVILARSLGKMEYITKVVTPLLSSSGKLITYKSSKTEDFGGLKVLDRRERIFSRGQIFVLKWEE